MSRKRPILPLSSTVFASLAKGGRGNPSLENLPTKPVHYQYQKNCEDPTAPPVHWFRPKWPGLPLYPINGSTDYAGQDHDPAYYKYCPFPKHIEYL